MGHALLAVDPRRLAAFNLVGEVFDLQSVVIGGLERLRDLPTVDAVGQGSLPFDIDVERRLGRQPAFGRLDPVVLCERRLEA